LKAENFYSIVIVVPLHVSKPSPVLKKLTADKQRPRLKLLSMNINASEKARDIERMKFWQEAPGSGLLLIRDECAMGKSNLC
jgi:hypothetical protein